MARPSLVTMNANRGNFVPELIGINLASTFTGFCSKHDKELFSPIEDRPFTGSKQQCLLVGYKALAREHFTKSSAVEANVILRDMDRGKSISEQIGIQQYLRPFTKGLRAGLRNTTLHLDAYNRLLETGNYDSVRGHTIFLESPPSVMCSGAILPECDFAGNRLQDLALLDNIPDCLAFSIFASGTQGVASFVWLEDSDISCSRFVDSSRNTDDAKMTDALIRFSFEFCENVFMSPDWWEGLSEENRATLIRRLNIGASPFEERHQNCLVEDNHHYDTWKVQVRVDV